MAETATEPTSRRRTFGPVVLLGLAGAGLTAIAGDQPAAEVTGKGATLARSGFVTYDAHLPVVTALGLVTLACWGVVLVTRGRVRRAVAALGAVASLGAFVSVLAGYSQVPDRLREELEQVGVDHAGISHTAWFWLAGVGALMAIGTSLLAVSWAPEWPEMGSRYDAPGAGPATTPVAPEEQTSLDLWKAMDEGRDPTAETTDTPDPSPERPDQPE
jgi:uncharacterized membrane protein (TIGR02234 family)